jgi:hypothetical protein
MRRVLVGALELGERLAVFGFLEQPHAVLKVAIGRAPRFSLARRGLGVRAGRGGGELEREQRRPGEDHDSQRVDSSRQASVSIGAFANDPLIAARRLVLAR